jgi:hypothetical protein
MDSHNVRRSSAGPKLRLFLPGQWGAGDRLGSSQQAYQGADHQVSAEELGDPGHELLGVAAQPGLGSPEHPGGALGPDLQECQGMMISRNSMMANTTTAATAVAVEYSAITSKCQRCMPRLARARRWRRA